MALNPIIRTISGKGVLQIPDEFRRARRILLFVQVLRPPKQEYLNVTWNPGKRFYANITFNYQDFVYQEYAMHYPSQMFEVWASQPSQNLLTQICALDAVLDSFVNFAIALGLAYTKNNPITVHGYSTFLSDKIKFVCYGGTALRLTLQAEAFDRCKEGDGTDVPPPPPPPPLSPVPPGTPVDVDDGYDGGTDGGDTVPDPIDDQAPPPFGEACTAYTITYSYDAISGTEVNRVTSQVIRLWGEIGSARTGRDANNDPIIEAECRGLADFQECGEFAYYGINTLIGAGLTVEFDNVVVDNIA